MKRIASPASARRFCRHAARPLVVVPTMGALHAGHRALLERGRRLAGTSGTLVATIFVNPSQFGPREDFSRYPRPFAADAKLCREAGADLLFHPEAASMYAPDFSAWINEEQLSRGLCGAARPGHFRGVCTVVAKLFHILAPDIAVFGEKDFQQLAIVRRMVRDLDFPVRIVGAPTVREADGLALSSRNRYLNAAERAQAPTLRKALLKAAAAARSGTTESRALKRLIERELASAPLARVDYIGLVDEATLAPVARATDRTRIAAAVFFGGTRLIDNLQIRIPAR